MAPIVVKPFLDTGLPTRHSRPRPLSAVGVAAVVAAGACYPAPPEPGVSVDEQSILSAVRTFQASSRFVRLNQAAYATSLASGALINVYLSGDGSGAYAAVTPEVEGSGVALPEGTLIVREVLGAGASTLTLMYKGAPGYNPELGDYWFGVTDIRGEPVVADGELRLGRLDDCYSCHLERPDDDFLFGVPATHRQ